MKPLLELKTEAFGMRFATLSGFPKHEFEKFVNTAS